MEDALAATHHPKVESYGDYLYLILHRIDFEAQKHRFVTHDVDFFLGYATSSRFTAATRARSTAFSRSVPRTPWRSARGRRR